LTTGPDVHPANDTPAAVNLDELEAHARKMHYRQMLRRGLVVVVVLAVLGVVTVISFPVYKQISTEWTLGGSGFRVDWDLNSDNWMTGGVTRVECKGGSYFWGHSHDPDLVTLSQLFHLESLKLKECDVSEEGLSALSGLRELKDLDLSRLNHLRYGGGPTGLKDSGLIPVQGLTQLQILSLSGNRITDKGLDLIAHLPNLETLDIDATDVSDAGLVTLQTMKNLKAVRLGGTGVTPEGVKRLQEAIPGIDIDMQIDPVIAHELMNLRRK
jgi:hypothetical protein